MINHSWPEVIVTLENRQLAPDMCSGMQDGIGARKALDLLTGALTLIDAVGAPADIGAHLDLAMHRLRDWIETSAPR
jgi:hypothetical protein